MSDNQRSIGLVEKFSAHNYHPLPVVIAKADGVWVHDADGKRYMDMLAAYSAVNFGHSNKDLIDAAKSQLERVTLTSRAFHNDQLGPFCKELSELCGMEAVLPMNTGAEGVETAIKTARKWGYQKKGVANDKAKIIVCGGNFHGRTTTVISFSDDPQCREGFGPFTPGFEMVPFGDIEALKAAIDENTVGFLFEPIQGEAGIIIPPKGFIAAARKLCTDHNILMIADEIQAGLGRTGKTFACEHEDVVPDIYILGKALGGGIMPVSAVVSSREILSVFRPGDHGSTFGGNPLGCAVARQVVTMLKGCEYQQNATELGDYLVSKLHDAAYDCIAEIRARGLWIGIDIKPEAGTARTYCERLMALGMLCKETHEQTIRIAPPLSISRDEVDWALDKLAQALGNT